MFAKLALALALIAGGASAQSIPFLTSISPASIPAGSGGFQLTINGTNFVSGAYVSWNGTILQTTFITVNQLQAAVPTSLLATAALIPVTVVNPGNLQSNFYAFTITSSPLTITSGTLTAASVGVAYTTLLSATGGSLPYTWSAPQGLPAGLTLSSAGLLSGTPTTAGTFNVFVQLTDGANNTVTKTLSLTVATPSLTITSPATLSAGTATQSYTTTFAAVGGTAPYRWAASQTLPPGLSLSTAGTLSGTPTTPGTYTFQVQVTDNANTSSTGNFTMTVNAAPLNITTIAPLFNGTIGVGYAQTFTAVGGVPPYKWAITGGDTGGLTLDPNSGILSGTPRNAGTFSFTIQVSDTVNGRASQNFSVTVAQPTLSITTPATLPAGQVGVSYNQRLAVTGGTAPYSWTLISGSVPGLNFDESQGVLSETPVGPGTYTLVIQARDANGAATTKTFSITINPAALRITTANQFPDSAVTSTFFQQMTASGGVPPYTWSANALPDGLTLDPNTGVITGTPAAAGPLQFTIRVTDSARNTAVDLFRLNVTLPALPAVRFTGLPTSVDPAKQFTLQIAIGSAFPAPVTGQAILSFAPDSGGNDATIQFASGGRTADFTIPTGSTDAQTSVPLAIQTGTVAGTISVSLRLQAGGVDVTPSNAPVLTARIERAAPVITSARIIRNSTGFDIEVAGYTTAREITQAVFRFSPVGSQTLAASQVTVQLEAPFTTWFQDSANARYGSQFVMTQPFTITGDANAVSADQVTLTNRIGSATASITK